MNLRTSWQYYVLEVMALWRNYTKEIFPNVRGAGRHFSRGGGDVLNGFSLQKGWICTDLIPDTLYRKCIKSVPKNGGEGVVGDERRDRALT